MTIKPVASSQKGKDELSDDPNQNLVGERGTNSPKREKRKNTVFEDRHRRPPQKSCSRTKRDHQKRQDVRSSLEREKHVHPSNLRGLTVNDDGGVPANSGIVSSPSSSGGVVSAAVSIGPGSQKNNTQGNGANAVIDLLDDSYSGYNSGDEHMNRDAGLTPTEWKDRDEKFITTMSERGLIVKEIEEDGACLFRAISLQMYGDQDMHEDIRQQTMDYISQNQEYFAQFVTEDIVSYIDRKRNNHVHGNHIEIQAMSEMYNRPVELYCYQTNPINIFNSEQRDNGYEPLRLSYQRCSHYNAILDPYKASVGVGLGLAGYKPDELDLKQITDAVRQSEEHQIEQTMFEDKLKTTDWEATNEAIQEQIARESYLQWCRDNMKRACTKSGVVSATVTSSSMMAGGCQPGSSSGGGCAGASASGFVGSSAASVASNDLDDKFKPSSTLTAAAMSPKERPYHHLPPLLDGDGRKSPPMKTTTSSTSSSSSSSSYYDQTSSGSCSSSQFSDSAGLLRVGSASILPTTGPLLLLGQAAMGRQQRRRKQRLAQYRQSNSSSSSSSAATVVTSSGTITQQLSIAPLELTSGLNMLETRSTEQSNDSNLNEAHISGGKKLRRQDGAEAISGNVARVEASEKQEEEDGQETSRSVSDESSNSRSTSSISGSNEVAEPSITAITVEPGPSSRRTTSSLERERTAEPPASLQAVTEPPTAVEGLTEDDLMALNSNFYHSLLESSYKDDGPGQMTETEMIERAIQLSRLDYMKKLQKHSDYDSP